MASLSLIQGFCICFSIVNGSGWNTTLFYWILKYTWLITLERNLIRASIVTFFTEKGTLGTHLKIHTGEKTYQWVIFKTFSEQIYLECIRGITLRRYLMSAAIVTKLSQGKVILIYTRGLTLGRNHISVAIITKSSLIIGKLKCIWGYIVGRILFNDLSNISYYFKIVKHIYIRFRELYLFTKTSFEACIKVLCLHIWFYSRQSIKLK